MTTMIFDWLNPASLRRRYVAMLLVAAAGISAVDALLLLHPFGWVGSIGIGLAGVVLLSFLLNRMGKPIRTKDAERQLAEIPDHLLKATDDPNEPARWVP